MNLAATMFLKDSFSPGMRGALGAINPVLGGLGSLKNALVGLAAAAGVGASIGGMLAGLKNAFDLGGTLDDLKARTGEGVASLAVLRQAFDEAGIGAQAVGPTIGLMQKALAGVNEQGEPTVKAFERLGLRLGDLRKLSASEQMDAIGSALRGVQEPAQRTALAMQIFGRSGAEMLQLFNDPDAIKKASAALGTMPGMLARNAELFARLSDTMNNVKVKMAGLFVGIADKIAPVLGPLLEKFNSIDFAKWGQQIGTGIAVIAEAFQQGQLGALVGNALKLGFMESVNVLASGIAGAVAALPAIFSGIAEQLGRNFARLFDPAYWAMLKDAMIAALAKVGEFLLRVFKEPLAYIQAGMEMAFQKVFNLLAKIPFLKDKLGLAEVNETFDQKLDNIRNSGGPTFFGFNADDLQKQAASAFAKASATWKVFAAEDAKEWGDKLQSAWAAFKDASANFKLLDTDESRKALADQVAKLKELAAARAAASATPAAPAGGGNTTVTTPSAATKERGELDQYAKIGLFIGGGGGPALDYARRTATAAEKFAEWVRQGANVKLGTATAGGMTYV